MITGFNTDVRHEGQVYHVQTEDRGKQNPILESLVYVGGTIVAKKLTSYSDHLDKGAGEDAIGALLKRQHQVVIAAIKAGRIEDLKRHTLKQQGAESPKKKRSTQPLSRPPAVASPTPAKPEGSVVSSTHHSAAKANPPANPTLAETGGLNLDSVIADYLKRASGEARLDVKVLTPAVFTAGKNVGLRVQVTQGPTPETDSIVTVKIIGTAFKPQVFIRRVGGDGVASFSLALPSFTTGTAAIVIEAQSGSGRGELKNLIRRA